MSTPLFGNSGCHLLQFGKLPQGLAALNEMQEYKELAGDDEKLWSMLLEDVWLDHPVDGVAKTEFSKAVKAFATTLNNHHKKVVNFHIKIGKRKRIIPSALTVLSDKRNEMKIWMLLMSCLQDKVIDVDTTRTYVKQLKTVPIAIHMLLRCTCLQESMRCGDTESFAKELSSAGGAASETTLQIVHKEGIELGLVKLASAIGVNRGRTSYRVLQAMRPGPGA